MYNVHFNINSLYITFSFMDLYEKCAYNHIHSACVRARIHTHTLCAQVLAYIHFIGKQAISALFTKNPQRITIDTKYIPP